MTTDRAWKRIANEEEYNAANKYTGVQHLAVCARGLNCAPVDQHAVKWSCLGALALTYGSSSDAPRYFSIREKLWDEIEPNRANRQYTLPVEISEWERRVGYQVVFETLKRLDL